MKFIIYTNQYLSSLNKRNKYQACSRSNKKSDNISKRVLLNTKFFRKRKAEKFFSSRHDVLILLFVFSKCKVVSALIINLCNLYPEFIAFAYDISWIFNKF